MSSPPAPESFDEHGPDARVHRVEIQSPDRGGSIGGPDLTTRGVRQLKGHLVSGPDDSRRRKAVVPRQMALFECDVKGLHPPLPSSAARRGSRCSHTARRLTLETGALR